MILEKFNKKASIKEAFLIQCRGSRIQTYNPLFPKQEDY
tara:strand:+ start:542 stop:658 length:117 start_codon:yes stop_codon:yes gene_type:complete